jgi:hypothetical protein
VRHTDPGVARCQIIDGDVAFRITRTREFLADGNDDLTFIINQSGSVVTQSRPRYSFCVKSMPV